VGVSTRHASLIAAVAAVLALTPAARAQDVARLPLGSTIGSLVVTPDGGAWVGYAPAGGRDRIARVSPDGQVRTAVGGELLEGELGLDGHAWFRTRERGFLRADGDLRLTRVAIPRRFIGPFAIGMDGTLWTPSYDGRMAHISAQGTISYTPASLPEECTAPGTEQSELNEMVRASDGAMWVTDFGCDRLLRVVDGATTAIAARVTSFARLTPDVSGGVWFAPGEEGDVAHVDAGGTTRTQRLALGAVSDIAVGADGSAWFAHERCRLTRIDPGGAVTEVAAPIVTHRLGVDATGRLLLAGVTRLARLVPGTPSSPCDDEGPALRVRPERRRISLAALRRGFRVTVGERAALVVATIHFDRRDPESGDYARGFRPRRTSRAATVRYRFSGSRLRRCARRLAEGSRPRLLLGVTATDADGNRTNVTRELRLTR
jgi:streptogramin lyase